MHGRIKTRSTAEQEKIKKLEREKKIREYKNNMTTLIQMRKSECYTEKALEVTSDILLRNPDIITAWNYRREIHIRMKETAENPDDHEKLLEKDLNFVEQCLKMNPKSYPSWHYRMWLLCSMEKPDWDRELILCKRYLELDDRNFHCWDYRKFVAQKAGESDMSEYEYTLDKIKANFSNYSAWHLRSKLLPKLFPDKENKLPVSEENHREEMELVLNAAFTDPNDQSAWFYQRWLLGLTEPKTHFVCVLGEEDHITVAVSKKINMHSDTTCSTYIKIEINDKAADGTWTSLTGEPHSTVWTIHMAFKVTENDEITLYLEEGDSINDKIQLKGLKYCRSKPYFVTTFSPNVINVLYDELTNCDQLLELEPDSKWTMLTRIFLMQAIDGLKYQNDIQDAYHDLMDVDPARMGYYKDMCSKFMTECAIRQFYSENNLLDNSGFVFALNYKHLSHLFHMQYLMILENVDLKCNSLTSESLSALGCLLNCKNLNLNDNKITSLRYLPVLPNLISLSLLGNDIQESCSDYLERFENLMQIIL